MNAASILFLATSYSVWWVMLSGLLALALFPLGVLDLLLALLTILFRVKDNRTRRRACRLLLPLSGACFALLFISIVGDELDRHHPLDGIFTNVDFYKELAFPGALILASLAVLLLDRHLPRTQVKSE